MKETNDNEAQDGKSGRRKRRSKIMERCLFQEFIWESLGSDEFYR